MDPMFKNHSRQRPAFLSMFVTLAACAAFIAPTAAKASDQAPDASRPGLLISNDQIPEDLKDKIYSKPIHTPDVTPDEVMGQGYYDQGQVTVVGEKIKGLEGQLSALQGSVSQLLGDVNNQQKQNEEKAAQYYADVATINTQLQAGTTKGNPRLVHRMQQAQSNLESLGSSVSTLNALSAQAASKASEASYLLEATRAAYSLSGAVEEDHVHLAQLEDAINSTSVIVERLLNNVNDDITRTSTYLTSERDNLRTLALAVDNGDLYGKSLSNRPFSNVGAYQKASANMSDMAGMTATPAIAQSQPAPQPASVSALAGGPRPLVKIRFDRPDVEYQQPVYMAVNEALHRYPNASFDLIAVTPTQGNAAEVAIESTRARRNAEKVLRALTQMGLTLDRVNLSYQQSADAKTNEVHLYIH